MTDEQAPAAGEVIAGDPSPPASTAGRRRWSRRRKVLVGMIAVIGTGIAYYAVNLYQVWSTGRSDQSREVDAIVVMGAAQYNGRPSPLLAARLDHAVELWRRGLARYVVVTGGKQPADRFTEAAASLDYLVDRGVPADRILAEDEGRNSYDSLVGVAEVMRPVGRRVLLVSDPFHSLRIRLIAEELGLTAYVSPTRTSPLGGSSSAYRQMKEAAGVSIGRLIGFGRLTSITG